MKSSSDVFDAVNSLEERFPVATWRAGDIDLWPTYRLRLCGNAMHRVLANDTSGGLREWFMQLFTRASRAIVRVPVAALRDHKKNAPLRRDTGAVFFSDGVSFVRLGGVWIDRVMDPVMESLAERGCHSLKLTPMAEAHVPRYMPSRFVQPAIDRIKLLAIRSPVEVEAPEFESSYKAACELLGDAAPTFSWLRVQAARLHALAKWFEELFERTNAHYAFVNTYYSLEGLAFVQAARRLGIRSVDLQHGIQGPHHPAYGRWAALPSRGYSTLPDEFWVWGGEECSVIDAWRRGCPTHVPRITGNFWLQRWREARDATVQRYLAHTSNLRRQQPGVTQVLICLTWGVPESETTKLIEAAQLAGPSFAWWWRLHPVHARQSGQFARRLEKAGLDGSQVAEATDAPLYALIRAADVTVAHSSTVLQESVVLGIPAVITSDYGAELHSNLLDSGAAVHATDPAGIAAALRTLATRRPSDLGTGTDGGYSLRGVIEEMLPSASTLPQRGVSA